MGDGNVEVGKLQVGLGKGLRADLLVAVKMGRGGGCPRIMVVRKLSRVQEHIVLFKGNTFIQLFILFNWYLRVTLSAN